MFAALGNSGAPRWYDCDPKRFGEYLQLLTTCQATAAEIVLHDGDADEFTSRVHVLRQDWETVIRGYRDQNFQVFAHGPLTPEFSALRWRNEPNETIERYDSILRQVAEVAEDQGDIALVLHGIVDARADLRANERATSDFLRAIYERICRWSENVRLVIELRAFRQERASAAATSRDSVVRIVNQIDHPMIGVCWDVAHDLETVFATGAAWNIPERSFLQHVQHLHVHDLGHDGEPHCPPLIGRVPIDEAMQLLPDVPAIMEVRWRMAERMGDPWAVLAESYRRVRTARNVGDDVIYQPKTRS